MMRSEKDRAKEPKLSSRFVRQYFGGSGWTDLGCAGVDVSPMTQKKGDNIFLSIQAGDVQRCCIFLATTSAATETSQSYLQTAWMSRRVKMQIWQHEKANDQPEENKKSDTEGTPNERYSKTWLSRRMNEIKIWGNRFATYLRGSKIPQRKAKHVRGENND